MADTPSGSPPPPVEALTRGMISLFNKFSQPVIGDGAGSVNGGGVHLTSSPSEARGGKAESSNPYKQFIATLKVLGQENPELVKRLAEFIDQINGKSLINPYPIFEDDDVPGCHEEWAEDVRLFLDRHASQLLATRFWANCSEADEIALREHLERLVLSKLHDHVYSPSESHKARDIQLALKIRKLRRVIDPVRNLDVKATLDPREDSTRLFDRAAEELAKISNFKIPREKIICITNACKLLIQMIKSKGESPIPDVFIPCLIYTVIQANPKELHSNVEYLAAYRGQQFMRDERGHYFLHFASAVSFIWRADDRALSMSPEEFESAMLAEVNDVSNGTGGEVMHSLNGLNLSGLPDSDWFESRFRFENANTATLSVAEVADLLEEYRLLVGVCRNMLASRASSHDGKPS